MDSVFVVVMMVCALAYAIILWSALRANHLGRRLERVLKGKPLFYSTMVEKDALLVRAQDYDAELAKFRSEIVTGKRSPWETVLFHVIPAFLFYDLSENRTHFSHAGSKEDAIGIVLEKVRQVSGLSSQQLKTAMGRLAMKEEEVVKSVVKRTSHLYVPFVGTRRLTFEEQMVKYGIDGKIPTLAQAREALLAD